MFVTKRDGRKEKFDLSKIQRLSAFACEGLDVSQSELEVNMHTKFFDGITTSDIHDAQIISAGELISLKNPDYTFVAARLLLQKVLKEVAGSYCLYPHLRNYIELAIDEGQLDPRLSEFDVEALDSGLKFERDRQFDYLGLQTVVDRYLLRVNNRDSGSKKPRIMELPQHFFMRVAMGLALREKVVNPDQDLSDPSITSMTLEFYEVLSSFDGMSSTPTLFNSGTLRPQMSSCFLNTVPDTLLAEEGAHPYASIFGVVSECAALSKWSGGIGTDWTRVRGAGDPIRGTNGKSNGIIPFLKVYNDTAVAVDQGGKRLGSFAPYLEVWHPDFMKFTELKKNSGDDRSRTHDIFPVSWIPDLFMKRVEQDGVWSFFSPAKYPELHSMFGEQFEKRYTKLEQQGEFVHQEPAMTVWRKILTMIWETGHPWITFKDEINIRNPQAHVGFVGSSNLCTEITLNTNDEETAVCNLASVNVVNHVLNGGGPRIDYTKLRKTVHTMMRMLDNVVDVNFYPSSRAAVSNQRHRPVGLGMMGMSDAMAKLGISWNSQECLEFHDEFTEAWSFYAIEASALLAKERGNYPTFEGSTWSEGILPIDSCNHEARELTDRKLLLDWNYLRDMCSEGMRNSNCMAIAPTATISNITHTVPCIEPPFKLVYTKTNLSGTFAVISSALYHGKTTEAFDVDPVYLIKAAAVRQKWIDQAQSLNQFMKATTRGRDLDEYYRLAWRLGCKTTYYLRREVDEMDDVTRRIDARNKIEEEAKNAEPVMCSIDNPDCESCQ